MTKTITMEDVKYIANETGSDIDTAKQLLSKSGYTIMEGNILLGDSKAAESWFSNSKAKYVQDAYRSDPLIRQELDAHLAMQAIKAPKHQDSNLKTDEQGRITGTKRSCVYGSEADRTEYMRAVRERVMKQYGYEE